MRFRQFMEPRRRGRASGVTEPCHAIEPEQELVPGTALRGEYFPSRRGQPVVAPAALPGLLDPSPFDELFILEPIERRIQRGNVEADRPGGSLADQPGE